MSPFASFLVVNRLNDGLRWRPMAAQALLTLAGEKKFAFSPFSPSFARKNFQSLKSIPKPQVSLCMFVVSPKTHQLLVRMEAAAFPAFPVFLHKYCLCVLCLNTLLFEDTSGKTIVSSVLFSCKPGLTRLAV